MTRIADPQRSFADLEFARQGVCLCPVLKTISDFIDQHPELAEEVRLDLQRGLKHPNTGRNGLAPEQVLRSLILMRIKNWDYRELRERISDGYTLRRFTGFDSKPVPKHDAFNRAFIRLTPVTIEAINDLVVRAAVKATLEDGSKLRVDTTVVQANVHHPTDSTLVWDSVRVITRLVLLMAKLIPGGVNGFRNRTRVARRRMQQIQRMTSTQRRQQQVPKYRELIQVAQSVIDSARQVLDQTKDVQGVDLMTNLALKSLRQQIDNYCTLGGRVVNQARRRVLFEEKVPNDEKLFSIFEPHTDIIKRGKTLTPVEFGHKVFLAESANGLISQYKILKGNPPDQLHVKMSLERHKQIFGCAPDLYSTDRGFYDSSNIDACNSAGVLQECIPQRGGTKSDLRAAHEKSPGFKKGQRFRAGIEGRISVLFRGRGMKRCLSEGLDRFEILVGSCVLANNLMRIAHLINTKQTRLRAA